MGQEHAGAQPGIPEPDRQPVRLPGHGSQAAGRGSRQAPALRSAGQGDRLLRRAGVQVAGAGRHLRLRPGRRDRRQGQGGSAGPARWLPREEGPPGRVGRARLIKSCVDRQEC